MARTVQVVKAFLSKQGRQRMAGELMTVPDDEAERLIADGYVKAHDQPLKPSETKEGSEPPFEPDAEEDETKP